MLVAPLPSTQFTDWATANSSAKHYVNYVFTRLLTMFRQISKVHHIINAFRERPLEPSDFCQKWIKSAAPGERGYYKACVKALAQATGLSERTIQGWGSDFNGRPDSVLVTLRKEDILNQIRDLVKPDNLSDYLES